MKFPDQLKHFRGDLPEVDDVPYFSAKKAGGNATLKEVRENLLDSPKMRDPEKHLGRAGP